MHHGNKHCNVPLKVGGIREYNLHSLFGLYPGKKLLKSVENFYWRIAFFFLFKASGMAFQCLMPEKVDPIINTCIWI